LFIERPRWREATCGRHGAMKGYRPRHVGRRGEGSRAIQPGQTFPYLRRRVPTAAPPQELLQALAVGHELVKFVNSLSLSVAGANCT